MSLLEVSSYGKIYTMGHAAIKNLFQGPVIVQEKLDGSQFSFGVFDGELKCRSRGRAIQIGEPDNMFQAAVDVIKELAPILKPNYTYRGEYLSKPKHNVLAYDRIPTKHIMLFDIDAGLQNYLSYEEVEAEAKRIGLEVVPLIAFGEGTITLEDVQVMLDRVSALGGQKIEGIVIKNYGQFGPDGKVLMGKHVSEAFKEVHQKDWKERNPVGKDTIGALISAYKSHARWEKAIQHLRERGELTDSPKDIGPLMKEVADDVKEECIDEIKERLFKWAWPQIQRAISGGLPDWYKSKLLEKQFENVD